MEGSHGQPCTRALHRPKLASYGTSPATTAGSALQEDGMVTRLAVNKQGVEIPKSVNFELTCPESTLWIKSCEEARSSTRPPSPVEGGVKRVRKEWKNTNTEER